MVLLITFCFQNYNIFLILLPREEIILIMLSSFSKNVVMSPISYIIKPSIFTLRLPLLLSLCGVHLLRLKGSSILSVTFLWVKNYEATPSELGEWQQVLSRAYSPIKFNLYLDYLVCLWMFHFEKPKHDVRVWKPSHASKKQKKID